MSGGRRTGRRLLLCPACSTAFVISIRFHLSLSGSAALPPGLSLFAPVVLLLGLGLDQIESPPSYSIEIIYKE